MRLAEALAGRRRPDPEVRHGRHAVADDVAELHDPAAAERWRARRRRRRRWRRRPRTGWRDGRASTHLAPPRSVAAWPNDPVDTRYPPATRAPVTSTTPGGPPPPEPSHAERCRTLVASASRGALSHPRRRPGGLPVRLGCQLRPRRSRQPALLRQPHGRAHPERHARPAGQPARHRAGTRRGRPARQRAGHAAGPAVVGGRRRPRRRLATATSPPTRRPRTTSTSATSRSTASTCESIRYVGGYGRMSWVDAAGYADAEPDPLADAAAGIIEHMNADHAEAQVLFCRHLARTPRHHRGQRCRPSTATASR